MGRQSDENWTVLSRRVALVIGYCPPETRSRFPGGPALYGRTLHVKTVRCSCRLRCARRQEHCFPSRSDVKHGHEFHHGLNVSRIKGLTMTGCSWPRFPCVCVRPAAPGRLSQAPNYGAAIGGPVAVRAGARTLSSCQIPSGKSQSHHSIPSGQSHLTIPSTTPPLQPLSHLTTPYPLPSHHSTPSPTSPPHPQSGRQPTRWSGITVCSCRAPRRSMRLIGERDVRRGGSALPARLPETIRNPRQSGHYQRGGCKLPLFGDEVFTPVSDDHRPGSGDVPGRLWEDRQQF